jgi:uncharacterized protein (TIGR03089 family)
MPPAEELRSTMPHAVTDLLARMRLVDPASPRLVWHGREGRIELSGRVFDNWVAKTSNLLVDELDAVPGSVVELDLPPHWKSVAIAFACWQVGCTVVAPGLHGDDAEPPQYRADIVMTHRTAPDVAPPQLLVCVALGSLAFRWDGVLPGGAVDYAAEVRSQGDVFPGGAEPAGRPEELVTSGTAPLTPRQLEQLITGPAPVVPEDVAPGSGTLLLQPGAALAPALAAALRAWREDSALVLVEEGVEVTATMLSGERVTATLASA